MHVDPQSPLLRQITPHFAGIPQQRLEADADLAALDPRCLSLVRWADRRMKMWRPEVIGDVVAQRSFDLMRERKRLGRVTVCFGRPIQEPGPDERAPWFCPVSISGAGLEQFTAIGGVDSLQALVLALEFATSAIPSEAARLGARAEWLQDDERIIFARHAIALGADNALIALLGRLKQASALLDVGTPASGKARMRAVDALNAIGASVGGRIASKRQPRKTKRTR